MESLKTVQDIITSPFSGKDKQLYKESLTQCETKCETKCEGKKKLLYMSCI